MTQFKAFETLEEAKQFAKESGHHYITYEEYTKAFTSLTGRGRDYMLAVQFGGLNKNKYRFCVQWNV